MEPFLQQLRQSARSLARTPGFALVVILTLAVGIGANTAIFSVVNGVLLRPLPYPDAERIVQVWQVSERGGQSQLSGPNFEDLQAQSRSFAVLARYTGAFPVSVVGGREPVRVSSSAVSREFFEALGVRPVLGRGFLPEEQVQDGAPAVLVSHSFWREHLGAERDLAGKTLSFQNRVHSVVGVMPPGFAFPEDAELWIPAELFAPVPSRTAHNWRAVGRLREGVEPTAAQRELSSIAAGLKRQYGDDTWMFDAAVVPLREQLVGDVRPALYVLLGAAGFLLLIACANVTNLLLARAAARRRDLAVRLALGARRARLVQQFWAEALVLSLAGGALAVLLAYWGILALRALDPAHLPRLSEVRVDWRVLAFALAISVLVSLALGWLAALRGTSGDLRAALAQGQRTSTGGAGSRRARNSLVVLQVALTLVLLVGAGLLGRSFLRLLSVDPGYRTGSAVVLDLSLDRPEDEDQAQRLARFHQELLGRLERIPGVSAVGGVNAFPLSGGYANGTFLVLNRPDEVAGIEDYVRLAKEPGRSGDAEYRVATEGYFRAMGIPLVRGRAFDERDHPDAPHVAVISESLARTRWPNEDPIGKLIQFGNMDGDLRPMTIVGVVGDIRERSLEAEPRPTLYGNARQRLAAASRLSVVMQTGSDPARVITSARTALRELAPEVPPRFRTLEEVFSTSLADRRFSLVLLAVFGTAALMLAVLGIYGVIAYLVAQRAREMGIRVAFGARRADVLRLVVGQGLVLAGVGIAVGVLAALALTRLLAGMLFGISPTDPLAFAGVALLLLGVALLASYLPARRAARVDPMVVLRAE